MLEIILMMTKTTQDKTNSNYGETSISITPLLGMVVSESKTTLMPGHPAFPLRKKEFPYDTVSW
jgi:hypothetical protein